MAFYISDDTSVKVMDKTNLALISSNYQVGMAYSNPLPNIDFAPLFREGDEDGKRRVAEEISKACSEFGFFQVINHGIPVELMKQALKVYRAFFDYPNEEKLKYIPKPGVNPSAGYFISPDLSKEGNEHFLIISPNLGLNQYPKSLPEFKQVLEEIFPYFVKLASTSESIINQSLGLPPNFLKDYNNDRSNDFLLGVHYFPATKTENVGKSAHEDTNCITLLYQDEVGGLQVCKKGQWIPVPPAEGTLIVNIGDALRVLSNDEFKSATHKVKRTEGRNRYSFAFFHNLNGDKWVEPFPQLTEEIGELPKYKGFLFEDYIQLRRKDRTNPPEKYEDLTRITRYSIN